ncbi:MAG: hypothetical protein INQ03_18225 [Candidatus Heimdallarchaeota archaeon]|nr:hypothetical protein [Candidatus Heimdallarchaeota archaeon]
MKNIQILTMIIISSFIFNGVIATANQASMQTNEIEETIDELNHYYDFNQDLIVIFYDDSKIIKDTALSVVDSLHLMTPNVIGVQVDSIADIQSVLSTKSVSIAIYMVSTTIHGVKLMNDNYAPQSSWNDFFSVINDYDIFHIFASGNSHQALNAMNEKINFYGPGDEQSDAEHLFVYALWTLADVLENNFEDRYSKLGKDIRMASLQYFAENFNSLMASNIEIANPVGQTDPKTEQARVDAYMAKHPSQGERIAREGYVVDPTTNRDVDPSTGELNERYIMDMIAKDSITPNDIIINEITQFPPLPNKISTGIRGPVGGLIDQMLPYLLHGVGNQIGLDYETVTDITDALRSIPDIIGAVSNPDGSQLKAMLEALRPMLPIPDDLMDYYDLIVNGIFALKGSPTDIQNFITEAIFMLLPDEYEDYTLGGFTVESILGDLFDISEDLLDMDSSEDLYKFIAGTFNEKMLKSLFNTVVTEDAFGLGTETTKIIGIAGGIVALVAHLLMGGDIEPILDKYGPRLMNEINNALGMVGLDESLTNTIMTAIGLILTATGVIEGPGLDMMLENYLRELYPEEIAQAERIEEQAQLLIGVINDAIERPPSDVNDFLDRYLFPALNLTGVDQATQDYIRDVIADTMSLLISIFSSDFSLDGAVNLSTLVTKLLSKYEITNEDYGYIIQNFANLTVGVIALIEDPPNLKKMFGDVLDSLEDMISDMLIFVIELFTPPSIGLSLDAVDLNIIMAISEGISLIFQIIRSRDNSLESLLLTLLMGGLHIGSLLTGTDLTLYLESVKSIYGKILDTIDNPPTKVEIFKLIDEYVIQSLLSSPDAEMYKIILGAIYIVYEVFTGGYRTVIAKITEWLAGKVNELMDWLLAEVDSIMGKPRWELFKDEIPIGIGSMSLFTIKIDIGLSPYFELNGEKLTEKIVGVVLDGNNLFENTDPIAVMNEALSFLSISPVLDASFELADFASGKNPFVSFMLESLGVELIISGSGFFKMKIFSFENGQFGTEDIFEILEWGFVFSITIERTFTLLDFLTGGAAGSLNSIAEYIGLDAITLRVWFTLAIEIIKRAASGDSPETSTLTLTIAVGFEASIKIDIGIAWFKLSGAFEVVLTLVQDLISSAPLRMFISIELVIKCSIAFLWWDWSFKYSWSPDGFSPNDPYELSPSTPEDAVREGAVGGDADNDGLSDDYENRIAGLNPNSDDSDGDGLKDKFEIYTLGTDPGLFDTDNDGLDDKTELSYHTDPLNEDTDFDGLTDNDEVALFGTNPLAGDSDEDGLDDYYEINHAYNISGVTTTVFDIKIGDKYFDDKTDPLNPDTDGDGLLDGEEGERGIYYGSSGEYTNIEGLLIINNGYTHPLDEDTDDDSYLLFADGSIAPENKFLRDMSDYTEIKGIPIIYIDPETGLPLPEVLVRTNPVCPDSDKDTAYVEGSASLAFMNSDGYELSLTPPSDPLDGDTDDDGLIDGLEGMLLQESNHTNVNNPDTDGDGLADMQELLLGTDPRHVDSDRDGITDGEEFFRFGTNPFLEDTDYDGLYDGEEIFFFHSSPFMRDTDGDGLLDYDEVFVYYSSPADEDSDNDFLTDWEEIFIYYTDPFDSDTDDDFILDGDEVLGYSFEYDGKPYTMYTDPLKWDTDNDTVYYNGQIMQAMSDYDEFKARSDPTRGDSDSDGIPDGWEVWVGSGKIPDFEPLHLDPLSSDTDGDGLFDGQEFVIANITTIVPPYISFIWITPFNTSATLADSDGDLLDDKYELQIGSKPYKMDTDNDSLTDYEEWVIYESSPFTNDTDGDGLDDVSELFGFYHPSNPVSLIYTQVNNSDSDGDLLPDGAEVYFYDSDPLDPDENDNEIIDGFEWDYDKDGLSDGEEYYIYSTFSSGRTSNAILDPDSDKDGLFDGLEVYEIGTDPARWDTDEDTYSDGLEVYCETDPLDNSTNEEEINACFSGLVKIAILSPVQNKNYKTNLIPVIVFDSSYSANQIDYRVRDTNSTEWLGDYSPLVRQDDPGYWQAPAMLLPEANATYEFELRTHINQETKYRSIQFSVNLLPGGYMEIISPKDGQVYEFNEFDTPTLPIEIHVGLTISSVKYTIPGLTDSNVTMSMTGDNTLIYKDMGIEFPQTRGVANYTLIVFGESENTTVIKTSTFSIKYPTIGETAITGGAIVIGGGVAIAAVRTVVKNGFKSPFSKGKEDF